MCTFDGPILRCEYCGELVMRDQTATECAKEHQCARSECPLAAYFDPCAERLVKDVAAAADAAP